MNTALKRDTLLYAAAAALVLPLVLVGVFRLAPELALVGVVLGSAVIIARIVSSSKASQPHPDECRLPASMSFQHRPPREHYHVNVDRSPYSACAAETSLPSGPPVHGANFIRLLWNSDKHVLIILGCLAWTVMPFDMDFVPVLGWLDDGFALALGFKHFLDLCTWKKRGVQPLTGDSFQSPHPVAAEIIESHSVCQPGPAHLVEAQASPRT